MQLLHGDCLELMKDIPDGSIDMILCDPPYGTTSRNDWDNVIPIDPLWEQYNRIIKDSGAIVLFSQLPFGVDLINGNRKNFRYEIIWDKKAPTGFLNANRMPLRVHENLLVFYKKLPGYNPQKTPGKPYSFKGTSDTSNYADYGAYNNRNETGDRFPTSILEISNANRKRRLHPTQKPVALLEYLIKTYTNPGEIVLDNCMGSGSTGVACVNCGRDFIGIEKDSDYFKIAERRVAEAEEKKALAYTE